MGLLRWRRNGDSKPKTHSNSKPDPNPEVPGMNGGMNGAVEVSRPPSDVAVFEFGSVANSADKVTIAEYCQRGRALPLGKDSKAPQFRIVF